MSREEASGGQSCKVRKKLLIYMLSSKFNDSIEYQVIGYLGNLLPGSIHDHSVVGQSECKEAGRTQLCIPSLPLNCCFLSSVLSSSSEKGD